MVLGRKCLTWILVVALALFSTGIVGCLKAHADEAGGEEEVGKELPAAEGPDDESASTGSDGLSSDRTSPAAEAASEDQAEPIQFDDDHVSVKLPSEGELDQTMAQLDEALLPSSSRSALAASTYSAGATMTVDSFSGALRFDTSAMEALAAFSSSEHAIIAGGEGWPDALAASTLAGALSCPIMLTPGDSLHGAVADALSQLGVNHVIVVGDKNAVSDEVVAQLGAYGAVERVSGTTRYETQLAIYQYGLDKGLWASDFVIVANGGSAHFADALSASPFAYRAKAPVFFVADDGQLPAGQEAALVAGAKRGLFKKAVIVGDENSVSQQAEGFIRGIGVLSTGLSATSVERLAGADRYATSAAIATWAVGNGYLSWDKAAFATGSKPYDALGGGALQGESGSVMLLVDEGAFVAADALIANSDMVSTLRFFGDTKSVSAATRHYILSSVGESLVPLSSTSYDISLDEMVASETRKTGVDYRQYLDPDNFTPFDQEFYQFAIVSEGYSGKVTAAQLDAYIDSTASGRSGVLRGAGQYFINAAQAYNVNEVYLLSHAILESGWGTSLLARGQVEGYEGYYNFFGIGAYDADPLNGGAALAKQRGWDSVEKAILGAAQWISSGYLHDEPFAQNTLYKMKWDIYNAMKHDNPWHQYATDPTWQLKIARIMATLYIREGIAISDTGLIFDIPMYRK